MSNYQSILDLVKNTINQDVWSTQIYIMITGDTQAGVFLDRIVWWSDKGNRDDGYFWKKAKDWQIETGLTYAQLTRIRKDLEKKGLIKTKVKRANGAPTLHYWANIEGIETEVMRHFTQAQSKIGEYAKFNNPEIQESRISVNGNPEIQESEVSEIQESKETITVIHSPKNISTTKAVSDKSPTPSLSKKPKSKKTPETIPKVNLEPESPGELKLFEKINEERHANGYNRQRKFKTVAQKKKFHSLEETITLIDIEFRINKALERGLFGIPQLLNYITGKRWNEKKGQTNGHHSQHSKQSRQGKELPDPTEDQDRLDRQIAEGIAQCEARGFDVSAIVH